MQKHRISTNLGIDQKITVELKQDFDVLEILSLKFSQQEIYTSICSDYGVVCGRITANNGFGLGNARVSIFIPLDTEDENDPVISKLYPYKEVTDKDDNNYRYNLLPSRQQHGGHAATGTFPDQSEILSREEVLEVYEKYYKYTVKTNPSGDFMIWGVPVGSQTIHVDVDLSDIGCFSLRPYDLQRLGIGTDGFKNKYSFKSSEDLDSLPQIVTFDKVIEVYPFWGNEELCEIGITRTDFDLSDRGVNIKPTAYLIGGVYTDNGKNAINKNCTPRKKMGRKCDLVSKSANIEAIRFLPIKDELNRPYLEYLPIDEDIPDDGGFVLPLEMNMDYVITNEFGENEYTNDFNKGIATSACYRFRFNLNDKGVERARNNADYLVPNIREFQNDIDSSYYFGTEWSGYPQNAVSINSDYGILYNEGGQFNPRDYFYRFNYNKVYTISSLQSSYVNNGVFGKNQYLGLKELVPSEEEDCSENVTPPVNFGTKNYTFTLLISDFLLSLDYIIKWIVLQALNFLVKDVLGPLGELLIDYGAKSAGRSLRRSTSLLQINNTSKLSLINYPECDECDTGDLTSAGGGGDIPPQVNCKVATIKLTGSTDNTYDRLLPLSDLLKYTGYTSPTCDTATFIDNDDYSSLLANQTLYVLEYNGSVIFMDDTSYGSSYILYSGSTYYLNDRDGIFTSTNVFTVNIRQISQFETNPTGSTVSLESGCEIYDTLYDETLATGYFVSAGADRTYKPTLTAGDNVVSTLIAGQGTGVAGSDPYGPPINGLAQCRDMEGEVHYLFTATPSFRSEFANGVFYIVPGTQSSARLTNVLKEYYRRKRIGKLFCGGIVNYGFIDNWLSGSLYFFQFKAKKVTKGIETAIKYCRNVVRFVNSQQRFYYRSAFTNNGTTFTRSNGILGFPTTIVDLGPRDEFIKEICIDKNLDPNCSVSRSIGPTSFKSFGELMGLAINYRMDVSNNTFGIDNFFDNGGFTGQSFNSVFDGDLLQLISINNEAGIEEFDLQNPKYIGYSYQILDPDLYPNVFKKDGYYGPLPVTLELEEDGERVRLCLNEPGRLTESSQKVPFYLWDKKGTGFGGTSEATSDDQSWDYSSIQVQPLQGMTYGYKHTASPNDSSDQYLLLPMTNTFNGLTITGMNLTNEIEFDVIIPSGSTHTTYNSEYPGYTVLKSSSNEIDNPTSGTLYIRYGSAGTNGTVGWQTIPWNTGVDFILPQREDYYQDPNGTTGYERQILSTPFQFYFGLKAGKTGLDKFIDLFGPKGAFPPTE
jgi:hypothetical protein